MSKIVLNKLITTISCDKKTGKVQYQLLCQNNRITNPNNITVGSQGISSHTYPLQQCCDKKAMCDQQH